MMILNSVLFWLEFLKDILPKIYWIESNIMKERFKPDHIAKMTLKSTHVAIAILKFIKTMPKK